jgi:hypothetical protein
MCQISESQVLVFGGAGKSPLPTYNDLWLFDLDSMDWKELNPKGWQDKYFPLPTYRMGMAKLSENSIVIYGGEINDTSNILHSYSDDTWIYYLDSNRWEWRNIGWPSARSDHMMAEMDSNLVLMVGGNHSAFLDNWIYVDSNYYWFKINDLNSNITNEYLLTSAITNIGKGIAVLFGGKAAYGGASDTWYDSTWVFDYYGRTWTKLDIHPHPSDRLRGRMAKIDRNKSLLFGGASQTNRRPEDTWLFVLDSLPVVGISNNLVSMDTLDVEYRNNEVSIAFKRYSPYSDLLITNLSGEVIYRAHYSEMMPGSIVCIPTDSLSSGLYFVVVRQLSGIFVQKIIVDL